MRIELDAVTGDIVKVDGKRPVKAKVKRQKVTANELVSGTNGWGKSLKAAPINRGTEMRKAQVKVATKGKHGRRMNVMGAVTLEQYRAMSK